MTCYALSQMTTALLWGLTDTHSFLDAEPSGGALSLHTQPSHKPHVPLPELPLTRASLPLCDPQARGHVHAVT